MAANTLGSGDKNRGLLNRNWCANFGRVMIRDFFNPTLEEQVVVLIDAASLRKAERLIESCEACHPDDAQIPFDNILDRVSGSDPSVTDYILESPAKCPNCRRGILEKTLIEPA